MILEKINKPNDIKKIPEKDLPQLAKEIRTFLIDSISKTGGHLASNLGVVELTIALHLAFDLPKDKIVWDVGHQAYTHKILTGRKNEFTTLRQYGGLSGFPKRRESNFDSFDVGHSSTSLSAALGYVKARDIMKTDEKIVAVIGDGALTGGLALEALNNMAENKTNMIMVLNDNNMSISKNVGGINILLSDIRTEKGYVDMKDGITNSLQKIPGVGDKIVERIRKTKSGIKQLVIPGMTYENMGITYLGPVDGHDITKLLKMFKIAQRVKGPVIVHVLTEKGRGYEPARKNPSFYHGIGPFDKSTGKPVEKHKVTYTDVFSSKICKMASDNSKIVTITASMADGTGLSKFAKLYPDRFFDVGIAEEHGVTFAAGLAAAGMKPYFAVYSSFLQRGFDEVLHDVCIQKLPVTFIIDRAGIVGSDGETHQGIFDYSYMDIIPGMTIMAPKNKDELEDMLEFSATYDAPLAIRYPRGAASEILADYRTPIEFGKSEVIRSGEKIAIMAAGSSMAEGVSLLDSLVNKGYNPTLINTRFIKPIDEELIKKLADNHDTLITIEENIMSGGFGMNVLEFVNRENIDIKVRPVALPDDYLTHGNVAVLKKQSGLDAEDIINRLGL